MTGYMLIAMLLPNNDILKKQNYEPWQNFLTFELHGNTSKQWNKNVKG